MSDKNNKKPSNAVVNSRSPSSDHGNFQEETHEQRDVTIDTKENTTTEQAKSEPEPASQTPEPEEDLFSSNWDHCVETFDDLNLHDYVLRGIYAYGFEKPSVIQMKAIAPIISGRDVIAQAQSGCGKTGAFTIGTLQNVDSNLPFCQVLAMSPTRELAIQTQRVFDHIGQYMTGLKTVCAIGGTSLREMIAKVDGGCQVVCATPGRVLHLLRIGKLDLNRLRTVVIDECDEMLDRGFLQPMYELFGQMPGDVQVVLASATMSKDMLTMTKKFMRNPARILIPDEDVTLDGIKQFYVNCEREEWKFSVLCDLYDTLSINQCVIFANKKSTVEWLAEKLEQEDHTVSFIHGDLTAQERNLRFEEFRSGSSRVLLSTDLIGRGIDVRGVSVVINFELPRDHADYIHRIGRSGRFGRRGVAINLLTGRDAQEKCVIEEYYSTQIEEMPENLDEFL